MHRRGLFIGAAVATATILTPGVASAETKAESYGVELDKYIESRPGLREIVEEQSQHLDREEIRKTLEALKEISEQAPIDSTTSSRESGDGDAPVIVPMKKVCVKVYGWMVRAVAWDLRIRFGLVQVVSGLASFTIAGLPASLVFGALGLGGSFTVNELFRWIDSRSWPRNVCVTVK